MSLDNGAVNLLTRQPNLGAYAAAQGNGYNEQLVAQGLPAYTEMSRQGAGWGTMATSAVAALVVRPSTVAAFEIFNGYSTGGMSLVIDRLFSHNLVTTAATEGWSLWACVTSPKAAPTSGSFTVRGHTGKAYGGAVIAAAGTTIVDSGWFPWTNGISTAGGGVTPFGAAVVNVEGRLIVPPQCSLCLHVVASLVGQTFCSGAQWYEASLTVQ